LYINLIRNFGIDEQLAKHLSHSYGSKSYDIATYINQSENDLDDKRIIPNFPVVYGEIKYSVENEYTLTAIDFLSRRTRISFLNNVSAMDALPFVIDYMGNLLNWDKLRREEEHKKREKVI